MRKYTSLSDAWLDLVPEYKSKAYPGLQFSFRWHRRDSDLVWDISERRCRKRLDSYLIPGELDRSRGSLRFGHQKTGRGYQSGRGDFCLLAGFRNPKNGDLTLFYRNLELIGGLHFDLPIYAAVEDALGPLRKITILCVHAFVFGVHGRQSLNKEKLYDQVRQHHRRVTGEIK